MGKMVQVEISSAGEHFQMARMLHETAVQSPGLVEPLPKGAVSGVRTRHMPTDTVQNGEDPWSYWKRAAMVVFLAAVLIDLLRLLYQWKHK